MRSTTRGPLLVLISVIAAVAGGVGSSDADQASSQQQSVQHQFDPAPSNGCSQTFHAPQYRTTARRIYRQHSHIQPKQLYRLLHMRQCAATIHARHAMDRITLRQRHARLHRRELAKARAQRLCGSTACDRNLGRYMAARYGWIGRQWSCLDSLWGSHESGWKRHADNPGSSAYGIPQALPGSKMGPGWVDNARVQIRWGLSYIAGRYLSPCGALGFWLGHSWY